MFTNILISWSRFLRSNSNTLRSNTRNMRRLRPKRCSAPSRPSPKSAGVECQTLHTEHEQVYQAIIEAAEARRCDLIVMASHGRRGVSAVVLGSETVKVLTHSKIPVLVYR